MAQNTTFTKTRYRISAQIVGTTSGGASPALTIGVGRVFQGWRKLSASDTTAFGDANSGGPFAVVSLGTLDLDAYKMGDASLNVNVVIAKSKNTSWEGYDIDDLMARMIGRIMDNTAYSSGETVPQKASYEGVDYELANTQGVVIATLRVNFFGVLCTSDAQV